jgi:NAD(P)-dependent dehydrogenase (short-subunit alcohol dehydrogenase family)
MEGLLRHGLLKGTTLLAAVPSEGAGALAVAACVGLGAEQVAEGGRIDLLICEPGLPGDDDGLVAALGETWDAIHGAANAALIPQERGKIVLIGPRPGAGAHAEALRAGLENMARTLSIEWARYAILPTMIAPGAQTTDDEVATLVTYLASPAGDYYSGCRFDLGSV